MTVGDRSRRASNELARRCAVGCLTLLFATEAAARTPDEGEEAELLRAIGYADYSSDVSPKAQAAVVFRDPERSMPGYNLYASRPFRRAERIDSTGRSVRSWRGSERQLGHWSNVRLLANGDLFVVGADEARRSESPGRAPKR
jgi:hypothetical protein